MTVPAYTGGTNPILRQVEFELISKLAYRYCGLDLHTGKQGLVAARLGKLLRELGLDSYREYYDHVTSDKSGIAMTAMVDCLTTNHTSFFRENRHFDFLRKVVYPELKSRSQIHLWSAACSSGEEPYSIALALLEESSDEARKQIKIKATDISTRVLVKGRSGVYQAERLREVPASLLQRYLIKRPTTGDFVFRDEVRAMIDFQHLNLMNKLPEHYRCSVIFCRNIMIYFDKPTQQDLVRRLSASLEEGGYLFIGHAESLNSIEHGLEYVSPAIYRKPKASLLGSMGRG